MKIRHHKKLTYVFKPNFESKLIGLYYFKYKSDLFNFLNSNMKDSLNGVVYLDESSFYFETTIRTYTVTYSKKITLKILNKKNNKCKINKETKLYCIYFDKIVNLMCNYLEIDGKINQNVANKLIQLYYKQGFKDFTPTEDELEYINNHIQCGIDFKHWCDRMDRLKTKTVIEYFNRIK